MFKISLTYQGFGVEKSMHFLGKKVSLGTQQRTASEVLGRAHRNLL